MTHPDAAAAGSARVFFSYAPEDRALRDALIKHLALMQREGLLRAWHDEMIPPGEPWRPALDQAIDAAEVILLLVSADYNASDECFERQMQRALARRARGEARVVPILLRPCDLEGAPFGELKVLPSDGRPVTSWASLDDAFADVAGGIRRVLGQKVAPKPRRGRTAAVAGALLMAGVLGGWALSRREPPASSGETIATASAATLGEAAPPTSPPASPPPSAPAPPRTTSGSRPPAAPATAGSAACTPGAPGETVVCAGDVTAGHRSKVAVGNQEGGGALDVGTGKIKVGDMSKVSVGNRTGAPADAGTRVRTKDVEAGDDATIEIGNQIKR